MTKQIRAYGEGLILEWLMDEFEPGHPNIERWRKERGPSDSFMYGYDIQRRTILG